jgi:glutaredoxin
LAAAALFYASTPELEPEVLTKPAAPSADTEADPEPEPEPDLEAAEDEPSEPALRKEVDLMQAELESAEPLDEDEGDAGQVLTLNPAPSSSAPTTEQSAELEKRAKLALSQVSVTMYSTAWCPSCKKARAWLTANRIRFREHDVEQDATARRTMLRLNPRGSVPTIEVDQQVLVGFGPQSLGHSIAQAVQKRLARDESG